ncbi:putative molybdenum carrier protein [Tellurirhabdus bombi]|uniref:putative molybdenum carrier protein n=1 Tax=Tellurirhabdus bombi TaxID=2907205 RepID=UPI001F1BC4E0|nr:putative molybdenum carrier protein [Tellurirhabdus bombi]
MSIIKIISGGQTGVDQIGLAVAQSLSIATGGTAPQGYLTEDGPNPSLAEFGLTQHFSSKYPPRTRQNVLDSDGTVMFGENSGGTALTIKIAAELGKPYIHNPTAEELRAWIKQRGIQILNVAGTRGSKLPMSDAHKYAEILVKALMLPDLPTLYATYIATVKRKIKLMTRN